MDVIKCVLVGDYVSEKTKLLIAYTTNRNPIDFVPATVDNYSVTVMINDEPYDLTLYDTASQDDYARLRPLAYPQTNVLLVCFSVVSPASFDNVREKWVPEITHHCPGIPFLLVGTQIELRDDTSAIEHLPKNNKRPVTAEDGENLAQELGAVKYMECSVETRIGMKNVFEEAVLAAVNAPQSKQSRKERKCAVV